MNHALLQLEILPFLICKSSSSHHNNSNNNDSIPASDFIHLFPGIQMVLEHVAGWAIRLCIQRGDCPPSITSVIMRPVSRSRSRSRSRNRSRSRAARFSNWTSQQPELAPYEKVLRISMEGVIGAREIREWMAEERKNSGFGGEGGGRGGGEEKKKNHDSDEDDDYNEDDDEDDDELAEVGSSLDGLVFQMKLKVLEAVDSIVRIVYGAPTESCLPPTSKSPEPDHLRHQITPSTDANADLMDATEYESDDEMRMFDLMRSLRIARHPRDPVPSSLVLKGKKMA
ncbi:hypothetical protein BDR26DRAFT_585611 [Obelidium mucronatum]|nr:hypothetical protein BDR26DRAFT_585611 [Obelidium mucronatum]